VVSPIKIYNEYILIFTGNPIGDEGAIAFSECLKSNSSLQEFHFDGSYFGRSK
jgi:hypothetical protein